MRFLLLSHVLPLVSLPPLSYRTIGGIMETLDWQSMLFDGWEGVVHVLLVGTLAYIALLLMLRFSRKRTLSRFSAFDLVLSMAIGSILGRTIISRDVPLSDAITAFVLIIALQCAI